MGGVAQLLGAVARHEAVGRPSCEIGTVIAVTDGSDADAAHSVDVRLKDSGLDLPHVPMLSGASGAALLPRVGDLVLLLFPRGDLSSAVAMGQLYSGDRRPPAFTRDQALFRFPGDLDDDAKVVEIAADVGEGRKLTLALGGDRDTRIVLSDGQVALTSGKVELVLKEQDTSLEIRVGGNRVQLKEGGGIQVETDGKLTLKAGEIVLEADVRVAVKGAMVELN